ncbi:hypothetical protein [Burkholderia ambifaria]|uniref:hypothetical protein n=1 Tax=Burkholderia ambifaria TaxID=152480 RepID=UPI000F7FAEB5|nr:hypothetical protein [Burkholderia ambifaria]
MVSSIYHEALEHEVAFRLKLGMVQVTLKELEEKIRAIGYRFNRDMDCKSLARYISGERAGQSYPSHALKPVQIDNGMSWAHIDARRDASFDALKVLRDSHFAVSGGHICEW